MNFNKTNDDLANNKWDINIEVRTATMLIHLSTNKWDLTQQQTVIQATHMGI